MKKITVAYVLMGIYVVLVIIGIVFDISFLTTVGTALAVFSFLYIEQKEHHVPIDEREKFIVERASSVSFILLLSSLVLGAMLNDLVGFLNFVNLEEIFQILIGLGFMTFVSMYIYYSEKI
jgi:hypothetical protein